MLAPNIRHPKEVTVRVYKAENLRVAPRSDHKQKKVSQKWKCVIIGGRKKISTECVYAPDGNPVWNFETTFKIATRGDPVVLLVSDSEDNHVGQVVVPGVTIPPKPADPSVSLTDNSRLCIMEMEQTKKTEIGFGRLYFWIWVEEYRSEESKSRSAKGSVLSLSSLHLHKDKGSTPNSLNYSGSVISLSSNNDEYKKKKRWYTKVANHAMHVPTSIQQSRSPSNSVPNTKSMNNSYNPFDYYQQNLNEEDGVIEEKDGSVLGAYSELTANSLSSSSAFATNQLKRRNSMHPSKRSGLIASNIDISIKDSDEHLKSKPELLRIAPKCGPSSGGTELTIYCRFLTTEIMKQSTVFVGDHPVSRDDWFLDESSQSDLSQLRVHMPSLQPGRYSIYIDSVEFGRILCNQEFTYLHSDVNLIQSPTRNLAVSSMDESTNKIINITPKTNTSVEETDGGVVFNRMGSQRSNLVLVDRRSGRRERSRPEALGRSDSLSSSILGGSSKMGTINHDKVDMNKHDNTTFNAHVNDPSKELSSQGKPYNNVDDVNKNFYETDHKPVTVEISTYILPSPIHFNRVGSQRGELKLHDRRDSNNNNRHHPRRTPVKTTSEDEAKELGSPDDFQKTTALSSVILDDKRRETEDVVLLNKSENKMEISEKNSPDFQEEMSSFNPISEFSINNDTVSSSSSEIFSNQQFNSCLDYSVITNSNILSNVSLSQIPEESENNTTLLSDSRGATDFQVAHNKDVIQFEKLIEENPYQNSLDTGPLTGESNLSSKQNFLPTGESELISSLGTPPKIKQSYKRNSQSNLPNRPINSAKFNRNVNLMPTRRVSLTNSQNPFNEDTDATDCVSTLSGETSQTMEYNEFNKTHHGSDRSAASGRSKSIMGASEEEGLKLENEALRSLLNDANHLISTIKSHTLTLETELNAKVNDVDRLSEELCRLKNRLLLDGLTQYLEKV
ncbi:unnamed protein product [Schistosoma rodhaini]|uniref:C2 domain-containing protein n=1 Tax=Schistosoma rodhaini TaxID=6188 RepID=A0AA85EU89_9TREM|nr:unnamed protein product [Schistosoma rodhaini]